VLLPFQKGLIRTTHFDWEMARLADRHYSRRTVGARQFCYAGRKLVLRDWQATVLFVWMWPDPTMRMDGQTGYCCTIFRNESERRSSELILEAEDSATRRWGLNRFFTYINPKKVKSANPGYCFKCAGWKHIGMSKGGLHLLAKDLVK
jgi:hypothetical protein